MKLRRHLKTLMVALLVVLVNGGRADGTSPCQRVKIPLHLGSSKEFEVTGSWLSTAPEGTMQGEISVRNKTNLSLSRITVMVNYLDANGSLLFSIPYQANLPNEGNEFRNVRPFFELHLNEPVRPGEVVVLTGTNLLSTTTVPSSAEVIYWLVKYYEDSSSVSDRIGQHGFQTDPLLVETPGEIRVTLPPLTEPAETFLKMRISEYGRVLDVQPALEGDRVGITREKLQVLSEQLGQWRFFPSVKNGYAVPSDLFLLAVFLPENSIPLSSCFLENAATYPSKFALVTFQPLHGTPGSWTPYYGGFLAEGRMGINVIETGPTARPVKQH